MLVKLTSGIAVNPAHVVSVTTNRESHRDFVVVAVVTGEVHWLEPLHRESVWATHDRVLKKLGEGE